MKKADPNPNVRYDLLLTLLNRGNEARWREHFRNALKKAERVLIRNMRSSWRPNEVIYVDPVPPGKMGLFSQIPPDLQDKVKTEQWHQPTDYCVPLRDIADLLITKGPGPEVARAFNALTRLHDVVSLPQLGYEAGRFVPGKELRPGTVTDIYVSELEDLLHSRWATRLRQCPTCQLYFIAQTRNGKKERCSQPCTNRYWNGARRRSAGHSRQARVRPPQKSGRPR